VSHQTRIKRPHRAGPKAADIQIFGSASSTSPGRNRKNTMPASSTTGGQIRIGLHRGFGCAVSVFSTIGSFKLLVIFIFHSEGSLFGNLGKKAICGAFGSLPFFYRIFHPRMVAAT
jgi:hypothetical protein